MRTKQKKVFLNTGAQGTLEYLVIIAIIIVIALVVVSLMTGFLGNVSTTTNNATQIQLNSGPLGITDYLAGENENGILVLKNNTNKNITINQIEVDGVIQDYQSVQLALSETKGFGLKNIPNCDTINKSYSIKVYYTTSLGLVKTLIIDSIVFPCSDNVDINQLPNPQSTHTIYASIDNNFSTGIFNHTTLIGDNTGIKLNGELDSNILADYTYNSVDFNRDMNMLRAYYKCNSLDASGKVIDYAGYDNNATLANGASIATTGLFDTNACLFDGSNDQLYFTELPINTSTTAKITMSVWFKINGTVSSTKEILYLSPRTAGKLGLRITLTADGYLEGVVQEDWGSDYKATYSSVIPSGIWHHAAIVFEEGTLTLYYNGIEVANVLNEENQTATTTTNLYIGHHPNPANYFNGSIDEVKVWERALSPTEIARDYNGWVIDGNFISPVIDTTPAGTNNTDYQTILFNNTGLNYNTEFDPTLHSDLNQGLLGFWHLNETSGIDYADNWINNYDGNCQSGRCPT
ncbi:MAG: LamG domain-containing protein, partial [Rickettsiales bacterium]|nr:LamG domain-containing protein [Rickettsiales bacterium]